MIILALLMSFFCQEKEQEKQLMGGPLIDAITKRIDKLGGRFDNVVKRIEERETAIVKIMDGRERRLKAWFTENFPRGGLTEKDRKGLIERWQEARMKVIENRTEIKKLQTELLEARKEWRPGLAILERLRSFLWSILWTFVTFIVVGGIILAILAALWYQLNSKIKDLLKVLPGL